MVELSTENFGLESQDGHDGCYYNDVSIKQIQRILQQIGLNTNQFNIRSQKNGQKDVNVDTQTIIEISKK